MAIRCKNYPECNNTFLNSDQLGSDYCEDCQLSNETAYDRWLEDFYGGSSPVTVKEKQEKAKGEKSGNS